MCIDTHTHTHTHIHTHTYTHTHTHTNTHTHTQTQKATFFNTFVILLWPMCTIRKFRDINVYIPISHEFIKEVWFLFNK